MHSTRSSALSFLFVLASASACSTDPVGSTPNPTVANDAATTPDTAATPDAPLAPDAAAPTDVPAAPDAPPAPDGPPVVTSSCDALMAGTVTNFMVDGTPRSFILTLPTGATAPGGRWPVVFLWHGLGDSAPNFNRVLSTQVNNATMPFILVTPSSTMLGPTTTPIGLEWEQIAVTEPNREARMFDGVVRCLDQRWGIDRDRVYTVGFSAGGLMSDLLAVLRGSQIAAVATYSGGYFANPANPMTLGFLSSLVSWPAPTMANDYTQLIVHGGATDTFNLSVAVARFNIFAANDATWLRGMGHDVIVCDHSRGHTVPSGIMGPQLIEFFSAHRRGIGRSPWAAALPSTLPSYCAFQARTR